MDQHLAPAASTDVTAAPTDVTAAPAPEQDAAGGIALKGRNRACARARALAGMVLTSGAVITLSALDTTVSVPR